MGQGDSRNPQDIQSDLNECWEEYERAQKDGSSDKVIMRIMKNCNWLKREIQPYTSRRFRN